MTWRYFSIEGDHLACPCGCGFGTSPEHFDAMLMSKLDHLRGLWGSAIKVTSAARCVAHNLAVGGEPNSAHTPDLSNQCRAVDLAVTGSAARLEMVLDANSVGFHRIGVGKLFVHVDVADQSGSPELPTGMWTYGDARG